MWNLPTKGRPQRCQEALDAMVACGLSTPGVVVANQDDPSNYEGLTYPEGWHLVRLPGSPRTADCHRWMVENYPDEPWYGWMTDDLIARTEGFDKRLVGTAGRAGIASANDLWQAPERMRGCTVFGGDLVRAVGYTAPPGFRHCFVDDVWETIGREMACWAVMMDVVVEHMHAWNGKAPTDATYEESSGLANIDDDRLVFEAWKDNDLPAILERCRAIGAPTYREVHLNGKIVAFGTPMHDGGVVQAYLTSMIYTVPELLKRGVSFNTIYIPDDSMVHRARNHTIGTFLRDTQASHLLFVDSDMGWNAIDVLKLLAYDKDIVCGLGMRKQDPPSFCGLFPEVMNRCPDTGCLEATHAGTGFMMVSRRLIEAMVAAHPDKKYTHADGKEYYCLFEPVVRDERQWSEDYEFCSRARALGFKIWVDPGIALQHVGRKVWAGALIDALLAPPPAAIEPPEPARLAIAAE